jgi:hypothetical protein
MDHSFLQAPGGNADCEFSKTIAKVWFYCITAIAVVVWQHLDPWCWDVE